MTIDHDDALLDVLGRGDSPPGDDELAVLLAAWRDDLSPPRMIRRRIPRPLVVALAATLLTFGGVTVAAATAEPGNPLWTITKIVYADRASEVEARQAAERLLAEAADAINDKRHAEAADLLAVAKVNIAKVSDNAKLLNELNRLTALLPGPVRQQVDPQPNTPAATPQQTPSAQPSPSPSPSPSRRRLLPSLLPTLLPL